MDKALHLTGNKYNMAVMVFTLAYVIFGVPANIMFKLAGPKSLSVMMFLWYVSCRTATFSYANRSLGVSWLWVKASPSPTPAS